MKPMKSRVIDNYISTIIGISVIAVSFYLLIKETINDVSFASLLVLGITYIRAKDSIIPGVEAK